MKWNELNELEKQQLIQAEIEIYLRGIEYRTGKPVSDIAVHRRDDGEYFVEIRQASEGNNG